MRFKHHSRHIIDFIFPISLFFVFAASSLAVLILAANLYSSSTARAESNDRNRTSLSYITEKIRQNDTGGNTEITQIDGVPCLTLTDIYGGVSCTTYIYEYNGHLKELFIKSDTSISLKDGKDIMDISRLEMKEINTGVFQFISEDKDGNTVTSIVSERSGQ